MTPEEFMICKKYLYNSYEHTITIQIYLADNSIPFSYTDEISFSELRFIFDQLKDYVEKKKEVQNT